MNMRWRSAPLAVTMSTPSVFQCLISNLLWDMLNYINNILIYSSNTETHITHIKVILSHVLENHLYMKAEKCEFHVDKVTFLG